MALTPFTPAQRQAVDSLVAQGRIAVVPADGVRAETFMRQAADVIADLPHLTRPQNQYNLAYDACHDVGEALMAGYGYRTLSGPRPARGDRTVSAGGHRWPAGGPGRSALRSPAPCPEPAAV